MQVNDFILFLEVIGNPPILTGSGQLTKVTRVTDYNKILAVSTDYEVSFSLVTGGIGTMVVGSSFIVS